MKNITNLVNKTINGKGDSDKHLMLLYSLVLGSNAKTIIELGVRMGNSTLPLVLGAKETNGIVYSVDKKDCLLDLPEKLQKYNKFYKQNTIKFLNNWDPREKIDLILVDDWHAYDHVKKELEILDTLVSPSTIILLHDLMYNNSCPFYHVDLTLKTGQWANGGPYRAVAELDPEFWEFSTLPWNNGMTILRKKRSSKYRNI